MDAQTDLDLKRDKLTGKIAKLKAARGAAIIDRTPFDAAALASAEADLAALDDAEEELRRRDAVIDDSSAKAARIATIAALRKATAARFQAAAEVQAAVAALAPVTRKFVDAARECERLAVALGFSEQVLAEANVFARLGAYLRTGLRAGLNRSWLGSWSLAPQPEDPQVDGDWARYEARFASTVADTAEQRRAPAE